jgi:hypothetical protein
MAASLTEQEFSQHVGTKFQLTLDQQEIELNLTEVKGYRPGENEQPGMERFSAYFDGPAETYLPQTVYQLKHDRMGEFEIFLVPIEKNDQGFRYEAVFNYFKA